ncbi:MAG: hypothetical protein BWY52_02409 [Chloroflexi bacterium ADurb.Bin325]|nr:MAG: hypothetical protein BWY52_02409 [Chloroflexi bacterium ADurb.Bin325]
MKTQDEFLFSSGGPPDGENNWHADLLELLFERMPMGIAILDSEFRIQRYNPTWGEFAVRYTPLTGAPLALGIALGAALGNIALGLVVGIILGGVGSLFRHKRF